MTINRRRLLAAAASSAVALPIDATIRKAKAVMIEPVSATEQMMYCTTRIIGHIPGSTTNYKTGTGFFYNFPAGGGQFVPVLVTNKHVIEETTSLEFLVHATTVIDAKQPDANVVIASNASEWTPHPNPKIDLCAVLIGPVANTMKPTPFFRALDPGLVRSNDQLKELNAVEDVLMVGYPNGLWDSTNNFPLLRRGITSSHPAVDFLVDGVATTVVDIASFPGSSGSPVFVYNASPYSNKQGGTTIGTRIIFLGILFSGPTFQSDGSIVIKDIPTANVPVPQITMMMNLGYIIKANELAALGSAIFTKYNIKIPSASDVPSIPPTTPETKPP
jgi:hypothetical protein